jgi:hypothetical protein
MRRELGGSQITALLESVPGIASVLRSPVADALVQMIRAGAGVEPFSYQNAEELVQYAVRRGLINAAEGDELLQSVKASPSKASATRAARPPASHAPAAGAKRVHSATKPRPPAKARSRPPKKTPERAKRR